MPKNAQLWSLQVNLTCDVLGGRPVGVFGPSVSQNRLTRQPQGVPLARIVAATFDQYLKSAPARHSVAVLETLNDRAKTLLRTHRRRRQP
jgi:hypothetical protein